jgi:tetratricopeptide (TPR) repeat protein
MSMSDEQPSRAGTLKRPPRFSQVPPAPGWPRPEWRLLAECGPVLGVTLWQLVRDVVLWAQVAPGDRAGLFRPFSAEQAGRLAHAAAEAPELAEPLRELALLVATPARAEAARVAEACERVLVWAEMRGMRETALQFAEAAARVDLDTSLRSKLAGRLCRRVHDHPRATLWYRRAARLARRAENEAEFSFAQMGLGGVAHDQGKLYEAELYFWKAVRAALRQGRTSVAGAAHHDLLAVLIDAQRYPEAIEHAARAIDLYPSKHPRLPNLAYDIGFLWMRLGYFSSAIYLFEKVLPWFEARPLRILVLAATARSVAAVHDRIRFERATAEVLRMVGAGSDRATASLYHLAEGTRYFEQWDRAQMLALRALDEAHRSGNQTVVTLVNGLIAELPSRTQGPEDLVPEEGSLVDRITTKLLKKLAKQPAPGSSEAALFPEHFPTD